MRPPQRWRRRGRGAEEPSNDKKKVVIVGAGPGGLATAMQLANADYDVTILERREVVGGRTSAIEMNGFRFAENSFSNVSWMWRSLIVLCSM